MSRQHISNIKTIATILGITVPQTVSMDQTYIKNLIQQITTKLATYDPTSPATGNAVAADVVAGKTFSNASAVGLTGTYSLAAHTAGDATAADIVKDKIAWVAGEQVTGTYDFAVATAGDATAADIALGKKAWVAGVEITGTHE